MELLDYSLVPGYQENESVKNAEALAQEQAEGEQVAPETGEQAETSPETATEEENPFIEGNIADADFVPRPDSCTDAGCIYGDKCPPTCGKVKEATA